MMFVLASNSPRRRELLSLSGWQFSVLPSEIDESVLPGDTAEGYVRRISERKARGTQNMLSPDSAPDRFILACDTAVVDGDLILGKPIDAEHAGRMLRRLRGHVHQVFSALTVIDLQDDSLSQELCVTDVPMRQYSDEEVQVYIKSGDPMDKAGAYAIQHPGFQPVGDLRGCYANVMGLPLCHLVRSLEKFGVEPDRDVPRACQDALGYFCPVYGRILNNES